LQQEFGLVLPEWTEKYYPNGMQEMTDKSYVYNAYNSELKKLKGGVFVKKALNDWESKIDSKLKQKIFVYAGHDSTVTNILAALNVWETQFPDYGIAGILEFSQDRETKEYGVEIFIKKTNKMELIPLIIPGCSKFCELSRFQALLKGNIPQDWTNECQSDFTVPPQSGP
jgi:prostatic aicd phosphatase